MQVTAVQIETLISSWHVEQGHLKELGVFRHQSCMAMKAISYHLLGTVKMFQVPNQFRPQAVLVEHCRDPLGNWESLGNPCVSRSVVLRETTFHAQATHVLPLPGQPSRFIFMADRWFPQALGMSRWAGTRTACHLFTVASQLLLV